MAQGQGPVLRAGRGFAVGEARVAGAVLLNKGVDGAHGVYSWDGARSMVAATGAAE